MKKLLLSLLVVAVVCLTAWQANALTGNYALGAGVASYNADGTPNISGVPLTVTGTAPWVTSTLYPPYLALTPWGSEAVPSSGQWYPLGYQNFVTQITTTFSVSTAGNYSFGTFSDDGSALYIDGNLVVNNGNGHGPTAAFASTNLTAGSHDLLVTYYEGPVLIQACLTAYADPRITAVPLPPSILLLAPGLMGLVGLGRSLRK